MAGLSAIIEKCTRSILPPFPHMGCGVVERHLEMAQPTKKTFALPSGEFYACYWGNLYDQQRMAKFLN